MEGSEGVDTGAAGFTTLRTPLLDMNGVATWLGTSHRHVRRMVAERRIPYVKVGHYIRFDQLEVARWIDEKRVGPADPTLRDSDVDSVRRREVMQINAALPENLPSEIPLGSGVDQPVVQKWSSDPGQMVGLPT